MTASEVAEYLQVKLSTIYQWTHAGYIPHIKLGGLVRFRREAIDAWIERSAIRGRKNRRAKGKNTEHDIDSADFDRAA